METKHDLTKLLLAGISPLGSKKALDNMMYNSKTITKCFKSMLLVFLSLRTIDHIVLDLCELNQSSVVVLQFSSLSSETGCDDGCFFWEEAGETQQKIPAWFKRKTEVIALCNVVQCSYEESNVFSLLYGPLCKNRHLADWQLKILED